MTRSISRAAIAALVAASFALPASAEAAFPGGNGRLAFTDGRALFAVDSGGGTPTELTDPPAQLEDSQPAWSPDGRRIAFSSTRANNTNPLPPVADQDIYTMNADGSDITNITQDPTQDDVHPAWSPDGSRIAFARGGDIYTINADGSGPMINFAETHVIEDNPAWSPDGSRIAFERQDGIGTDIFVLNFDPSIHQAAGGFQLTNTPGSETHPTWSPDGSQIAYARDGHIFASDATGTGSERQVTSGAGFDSDPAWSPDGKQIAFSRDGYLHTTLADGTGTPIPVTSQATEPDWQPKGVATPAGLDVTVSPPDLTTGLHPVSITFDNVTTEGATTLTSSSAGPAPPAGFVVDGAYYELGTTAAFTTATVCFSFSGSPPAIVHWVNGIISHVYQNQPVDNMVCTDDDVTSFSPFALARPTGDTEAPHIACGTADAAWHADNVAIQCSAEDTGSGLAAPADANFSLSTSVPAGTEDADAQTGSRQICDIAGNCATAGPIGGNRVDRRPPALSLPSATTIDATSPQGATVTYSASALDGADPHPTVSCARRSGSTFPIGTDSVVCTATDHVGNTSRGSFTITVRGAQEQLDRFVQEVVTIPKLAAQLRSVVAGFDPSNSTQRAVVCRALSDFITAVRLLSGHGIPPATATIWTGDAERIRAVLACGGAPR
ncbi:MAG TPA: DPP IV N-terminal domain-containing protein [Solirubrobacteraceae bacterium]|nr:DPP IV N-terminal domain-containing protein [Solirubrobacteraceae bacterium]